MLKQIHHDGYHRIVDQLRSTRRSLGMTQADVAEKVGVSRAWIVKVEQCELSLDLLHLAMLCRVYGLKTEDLVGMLEHGR